MMHVDDDVLIKEQSSNHEHADSTWLNSISYLRLIERVACQRISVGHGTTESTLSAEAPTAK
eukprot:4591932-Pleurochrysis_carterae.AAC.1